MNYVVRLVLGLLLLSILYFNANSFLNVAEQSPVSRNLNVSEQIFDNSLSRVLCVVLVLGSDIRLNGTSVKVAKNYPNCLLRVSTLSPLDYDGILPINILQEPIVVVSSNFNVSSIKSAPDGRPFVTVPSYLGSLERNRLAAVIVGSDPSLLSELLAQSNDFLKVVILQVPDKISDSGVTTALLIAANFVEISSSLVPDRLFVRSLQTERDPVHPVKFFSYTMNARFTNQLAADAAALNLLRLNNSTSTLVIVTGFNNYGDGGIPLVFNMSHIANFVDGPNRVLGTEDVATLPRLQWCDRSQIVECGYRFGIGYPCYSLNSVSICEDERKCSDSGCMRFLSSRRFSFKQNSTMSYPVLNPAGDYTNSKKNIGDERVATVIDSHRLFPKNDKSPLSWPSFSPIVRELSLRQLSFFCHQLYHRSPDHVRLLGIHLRVGDRSKETNSEKWQNAVTNLNITAFDGIVLCSDFGQTRTSNSVFSDLLKTLAKTLPNVPILGCPDYSTSWKSSSQYVPSSTTIGLALAIIQDVLARPQIVCYIGGMYSGFSTRIHGRRQFEGTAQPCDVRV